MKAEITDKFTVKGNLKGKHEVQGFGVIDFDTLTLKEAEALYKAGCPVFVKKEKQKSENKESK